MGIVRKLTEDEIQDKLAEYSSHRSSVVRDEIVMQYTNLVESIGRRFVGANEPIEDLVQEGYIGLIASVDKYDADKGVKFSTYATHFIIGQIKHYLRDKGKIIKEPAWLQELNQKMTRVIESLHQKHGRQPTEKEISDEMLMPESQVREMLTTREVFKVTSLDGGDKDEDSPGSMDSEKISDDKLVTFQLPLEDKIVLEAAFDRLKEIEQKVISDHYYTGHNQTEIAKSLGISCNYVSHILRNGTKKLRKILATEEIRDSQLQRVLQHNRTDDEIAASSSVLDQATGVYNNQYFMERLDEELSRAYRGSYKVALILVNVELPEDLDSYVRMVRMDDVLYNVGQSIKDNVRKMDVLARCGDSCFALCMPHTSSQASNVAERVRSLVSSVQVESGRKNSKVNADARIGIAFYPKDTTNSQKLMAKAAQDMGVPLEILLGGQQELKKAA